MADFGGCTRVVARLGEKRRNVAGCAFTGAGEDRLPAARRRDERGASRSYLTQRMNEKLVVGWNVVIPPPNELPKSTLNAMVGSSGWGDDVQKIASTTPVKRAMSIDGLLNCSSTMVWSSFIVGSRHPPPS